INSWRGAGGPNRALVAVWDKVYYTHPGQAGLVVTDDPAGVWIDIAMRRPGCVDNSVIEHEPRPLFVLLRIEKDVTAAAVRSAPGITCCHIDWTAGLLRARHQIECVQTLEIISGTVFAHRSDVDCSVQASVSIDHRCRGNTDLGRDLRTAAVIRRRLPRLEKRNLPEHCAIAGIA